MEKKYAMQMVRNTPESWCSWINTRQSRHSDSTSTRDKEGHVIMNALIQQVNITIPEVYILNIKAPKYI